MDPIKYRLPPIHKGPESTIRMSAYTSWGPKDLDLPAALRTNRGMRPDGVPVRVGIIDTGLHKHRDLKPPIKFKNFTNSPDPDKVGHQTHVTGTFLEYCPLADVCAYKGLDDSGSGDDTGLAAAIDEALKDECDIISASWGGGYSQKIHAAVKRFVAKRPNGRNGIFVCAAGNSGSQGVDSPGILPESVTTAAYDQSRKIAGFSSVGPEVVWAMPGVAIYSTLPGDKFGAWDGTSMATPAGSGVMGLYVGTRWNDEWSFDIRFIREFIGKNSTDIEAPGHDNKSGWGIPKVGEFVPADSAYWMF